MALRKLRGLKIANVPDSGLYGIAENVDKAYRETAANIRRRMDNQNFYTLSAINGVDEVQTVAEYNRQQARASSHYYYTGTRDVERAYNNSYHVNDKFYRNTDILRDQLEGMVKEVRQAYRSDAIRSKDFKDLDKRVRKALSSVDESLVGKYDSLDAKQKYQLFNNTDFLSTFYDEFDYSGEDSEFQQSSIFDRETIVNDFDSYLDFAIQKF